MASGLNLQVLGGGTKKTCTWSLFWSHSAPSACDTILCWVPTKSICSIHTRTRESGSMILTMYLLPSFTTNASFFLGGWVVVQLVYFDFQFCALKFTSLFFGTVPSLSKFPIPIKFPLRNQTYYYDLTWLSPFSIASSTTDFRTNLFVLIFLYILLSYWLSSASTSSGKIPAKFL